MVRWGVAVEEGGEVAPLTTKYVLVRGDPELGVPPRSGHQGCPAPCGPSQVFDRVARTRKVPVQHYQGPVTASHRVVRRHVVMRDHLTGAERIARSASPWLVWVGEEPILGGLEVSDPPTDRPARLRALEPHGQRVCGRQGPHLPGNELEHLSVLFVDTLDAWCAGESHQGEVIQQVVDGRGPRANRSTDGVAHPDHHTGVPASEFFLGHEQRVASIGGDGEPIPARPSRPRGSSLSTDRKGIGSRSVHRADRGMTAPRRRHERAVLRRHRRLHGHSVVSSTRISVAGIQVRLLMRTRGQLPSVLP